MAVTWFIQGERSHPDPIVDKKSLLQRFANHESVVVSAGITCAYLGDERNLREYLVADDAVRALRSEGHQVKFILFNDSLDALNARQLRVAMDKDPGAIATFEKCIGKPIADIPSPVPGHGSWAAYFENQFLKRLATYDCFPTLESTASLYRSGLYDPYIEIALSKGAEIRRFLKTNFADYTPQKLFYAVCPACGGITETEVTSQGDSAVAISCGECGITSAIPPAEMRGKLNWKLDCAARWHMFDVDVEPFSKSYLEPQGGSFWIADALGRKFCGGVKVTPIIQGMVKIDAELDPTSMGSLPHQALRRLFIERWNSDLLLTKERMLLAASKADEETGLSFVDSIKRRIPGLKARPTELSREEYDFLCRAETFQWTVLAEAPERCQMDTGSLHLMNDRALWGLALLAGDSITQREQSSSYAEFDFAIKETSNELGEAKAMVHDALRKALSHEKGLPVRRLLFTTPLHEMRTLLYAVERTLEARESSRQLAKERMGTAVVNDPTTSTTVNSILAG